MADSLQILLLGSLHIMQGEQPLEGFVSNKARALLCYLATVNQPQARQTLLGLFWGDMREADARANLRKVLSNLRQLVGDQLAITQQDVTFRANQCTLIDVLRFQTLCTGADAPIAAIQEAIALYHGDFLEGFVVRDAPSWEAWVAQQRERLRAMLVQALHMLARHHTARRERDQAIAVTKRLLEFEPYREDVHRDLMLLLVRSGLRSAALAQYETCRRTLKQELGIDPEAETIVLYERIRTAAAIRHINLSPQPTPFIGREAELADVLRRISDPACRLLTLVGPGGIGKTRLALRAAEQVEAFLHGVVFVPLAAVNSADFLVTTIADALAFTLYSGSDHTAQLLKYLRDKELLLVLDTFEHLVHKSSLLASILAHAPDVRILVTSRERLNLQEEWILDLQGLTVPADATAAEIERSSAAQLFLQSAARVQTGFALAEGDLPYVTRICELVTGMPLGVELAAAWVRVVSCQEIVAEIERDLGFLATAARNVPERHRSLRAVWNHSWRLLSSRERHVFMKLSVFRGGFDRTAAREVAGAELPVLAALVDKSLLHRDPAGRYDLHDLLRQYAAEKLQGLPREQAHTQERHCQYYAGLLQQREGPLKGRDKVGAVVEIGAEIDNVRSAWNWAVEQRQIELIGMFQEALWFFYEARNWYEEAANAFGNAVTALSAAGTVGGAADPAHNSMLGQMLARQGWFCFELGQLGRAKALLEQSVALLQGLDAHKAQALALNYLGFVMYLMGDYAAAQRVLDESLTLCKQCDDKWGKGLALSNLGLVARSLGAYDQAQQCWREVITIWQSIGAQRGAAIYVGLLGTIAYAQGAWSEAETLLHESLAMCQTNGDRFGMAMAIQQLGNVSYGQRKYAEAQTLHQQALTTFREVGMQIQIARSLNSLGNVLYALGMHTAASTCFSEALTIAAKVPLAPAALEALVGMATLLAQQGDGERAAEILFFVLQHPASEYSTKMSAEQLLADLRAQLKPTIVARAETGGRNQDLAALVAELTAR